MARKDKDPKPIQVNFQLNAKQWQADQYLQDQETTICLYGGAAAGGKSYYGCYFLISNAIKYPGTRYILGRNTLISIKNSTLVTFFKVLRDLKIAPEHYTFNQTENKFTFNWNQSTIVLKDLEYNPSDPFYEDKLSSSEYTMGFIDEVANVDQTAVNIVLSRLRWMHKEYNLKPRLLLTCNPSNGWVKTEYYQKYINKSLPSHIKYVPATVHDNKDYVDPSYITMLERLDPINRKRLLDGDWDYDTSNLCIFDYTSVINLFQEDKLSLSGKSGDYYLSIDPARKGKDETVCILWNDYNVLSIIKLKKEIAEKTFDKQAPAIRHIIDKYNIPLSNVIMDTDGVGGGLSDFPQLKGCQEFQNNSRPLNKENYQNLKTQVYYKLAELINSGQVRIYNCNNDISIKEQVIKELCSIDADKIDQDGKICIISKDKMKAKLNGKSPDFADALMLRAFYSIPDNSLTKTTGEYYVKTSYLNRN